MILFKRQISKWLRVLLIFVLVLGILFRFTSLESKAYWDDEAVTSLRLAGSSWKELRASDGQKNSSEEFQYQYLHNKPQTSLIDVFKSSLEDPQVTPLYYFMGYFWVKLFGNSIEAIRSLSAVISVLSLPCMFWLCLELFGSSLTAAIAVILMAISPFEILYAQEARMYSLWTLTTLLSSIAFLRAMRLKTQRSWNVYSVTLLLSLYTHLLSVLVAVGQGIYVVITEKFKLNREFFSYLKASLIGFLFFCPWLLVIIKYPNRVISTTNWTNRPTDLPILNWIRRLNTIFFDPGNIQRDTFHWMDLIQLGIIVLVAYSLYFIVRHQPQKIWLFVLVLGTSTVFITLPSLISGKVLSIIIRYQIPSLIGIQLAVANLIATQILSVSLMKRKIWQAIFVFLILLGIGSNALSSQAQTWWTKPNSDEYIQVASFINKAERPLLIGSYGEGKENSILALSYLLDSDVQIQLLRNSNKISTISGNFSEVFVFNPAEKLLKGLEQQQRYKMNSINEDLKLWTLTE
ncbi:conserved hypothetical protein [Gloeothece citriformis PCC 7424]|uniref:Glycosyltransferase RgtA/B/C/D-like domain-containing protein n=1 Tax=Gloeothece citriformis (strain PCC 7424) TaxID=65393 RepID=B7KAS7_GLOC7|nr:glycosyltransferase family 39 protein [Gloeothece citriformis]ACK68749.1 conserved hypothetical protein [Gloeothece citriformis PCC 7424]